MAEYNSTSTVNPGLFQHWNTPLPYLFGGLAVMLGLISFALIILACSYRKPPILPQSSDNQHEQDHDQEKSSRATEMEPRIVVIMAGDHNPTYLAKPTTATSSIRHCEDV